MQSNTRFAEIENVVLIKENFTYNIQSILKEKFEEHKFSYERNPAVYLEKMECISFDSISVAKKNYIENNIGKIHNSINDGRAVVSTKDLELFIQKIDDNYLSCFSIFMISDYKDGITTAGIDVGTFNLKYTEYEIIYCIFDLLSNIFTDKKEFNLQYNQYKNLFKGTEEEFLNCLLYPDRLSGFECRHKYFDKNSIPKIEEFRSFLIEKKNNLLNTGTEEQGIDLIENAGTKLSHLAIALLYFFKDEKINLDNADNIARYHQQGSGGELLKKVEELKINPLIVEGNRLVKTYLESIIPLLENHSAGKEKAEKMLERVNLKRQ